MNYYDSIILFLETHECYYGTDGDVDLVSCTSECLSTVYIGQDDKIM